MQPDTEGASLPANLSGIRTAQIRPLWKVIFERSKKIRLSEDAEGA